MAFTSYVSTSYVCVLEEKQKIFHGSAFLKFDHFEDYMFFLYNSINV